MKLLSSVLCMAFSLSAFAYQAEKLEVLDASKEFTEMANENFELERGKTKIQFVWDELQQVKGLAIFYERSVTCSGFAVDTIETLSTLGKWESMSALEFEGRSYLQAKDSFISLRLTAEVTSPSQCTIILADRNEALPNLQTVLATTTETCEEVGEAITCNTRLNRIAGAELATLTLNTEQARSLGLRPGQIYKIIGYEVESELGEVYFHISSAQWIMKSEG